MFTGGVGEACHLVMDLPAAGLDGAAMPALPDGRSTAPEAHPNGVTGIDHVVLTTANLERSLAALQQDGLELRRTREAEVGGKAITQAFYVAGPCVIELVGRDGSKAERDAPAALWGVTFVTRDIGSLPALEPPPVASIRSAVQPGRQIAVARKDMGLPLRVAFMDPREDGGTQ